MHDFIVEIELLTIKCIFSGLGKDAKSTKRLVLWLTADRAEFISEYSAKGQMLLFPITGNGISNFTLVNAAVNITMDFITDTRDGEDYLKLKKSTSRVSVKQ